MDRTGFDVPAGVVDISAWKQLRVEIWENTVNREHRLSDQEIRYMPWLKEMRPPSSWTEFVGGLMATMTERGYVYQRQYKIADLMARAYGIRTRESGWGRVYSAPGWPELHLYKAGPGRLRFATWSLTPAVVLAGARR